MKERTLLIRALVGLAIFTAMVALGVLLAAAAGRSPGTQTPQRATTVQTEAVPTRAANALHPRRGIRTARAWATRRPGSL